MITYEFNDQLQILEVFYSGEITFNQLQSFGNHIHVTHELPRVLKMLTDVTQAEYNLKTVEIEQLVVDLEKHVSSYTSLYAAFIQNKPKETAYSILLEKKARIPGYHHAVFSEKETALRWLKQCK